MLGLGNDLIKGGLTDTQLVNYSTSNDTISTGNIDSWELFSVSGSSGSALTGETISGGINRLKLLWADTQSDASGMIRSIDSSLFTDRKTGDYFVFIFSIYLDGAFDGEDAVNVGCQFMAETTAAQEVAIDEWVNLSYTGTATADDYATSGLIFFNSPGDLPEAGDIAYFRDISITAYRPFGN